MGIGKLYNADDEEFIGEVNYRLFHHEAATNWWGELTLIDYARLNEGDRYILELDDNRRGNCYLKKRVNRAVSGIPSRYIYHVTGFSPLE